MNSEEKAGCIALLVILAIAIGWFFVRIALPAGGSWGL